MGRKRGFEPQRDAFAVDSDEAARVSAFMERVRATKGIVADERQPASLSQSVQVARKNEFAPGAPGYDLARRVIPAELERYDAILQRIGSTVTRACTGLQVSARLPAAASSLHLRLTRTGHLAEIHKMHPYKLREELELARQQLDPAQHKQLDVQLEAIKLVGTSTPKISRLVASVKNPSINEDRITIARTLARTTRINSRDTTHFDGGSIVLAQFNGFLPADVKRTILSTADEATSQVGNSISLGPAEVLNVGNIEYFMMQFGKTN